LDESVEPVLEFDWVGDFEEDFEEDDLELDLELDFAECFVLEHFLELVCRL
jgi:hypothetical protein